MATPNRGDILEIRLTIKEKKFQKALVLVLSLAGFNCFGSALVCPLIVQKRSERDHGFPVRFETTGEVSGGLVLCHRLRSLRYDAYAARNFGRLADEIVDEVLARIHILI